MHYTLHTLSIACLLLGTLTACNPFALQMLQNTTPQGTEFHKALAAHYRNYAQARAAVYDWRSSQYFAEKGLRAARAQDTPAEDPADWDLTDTQRTHFLRYRQQLDRQWLSQRERHPEQAAKAQYLFDCWLNAATHSTTQTEDEDSEVIACRDPLLAMLESSNVAGAPPDTLTNVPTDTTVEPTASASKAATPAKAEIAPRAESPKILPEAVPELSTSYIAYFGLGRDRDDDAIRQVAAQVRSAVRNKDNAVYRVVIHGHTDRSGSTLYNFQVSQRRALAMQRALTDAGIAEDAMEYYAFGETDPAVPTADDVARRSNRRVEVFVTFYGAAP